MNRIRQLREERDITQQQLAKTLNVTPAAISKYENEKIILSAETIIQLCDIFDVSADYLIGRSNERGSKKPSRSKSLLLLESAFKECGALNKYGNITPVGARYISAFLLNNSKIIQKLISLDK